MDTRILEIAQRIKGLREILEWSPEQMAQVTDTSVEEYLEYESGGKDFSFTFLYHCAGAFGVDLVELLTGEVPKLSRYTVVRAGKGLPIRRREGLTYEHLAYRIKNKLAEPFLVTVPFQADGQMGPPHLSSHKGQEFDYVLKGSFRVQIENHVEVLNEGDSIFYDSGCPHAVSAVGGTDCVILAVVMKDPEDGQE